MQKVLSVSVAAYNVENFIVQCLDSFVDTEILDQIEVLVTDDGSTDSTREIVKKYQEQYPQTFRLFYRQQRTGPCKREILPHGRWRRLGADKEPERIYKLLKNP